MNFPALVFWLVIVCSVWARPSTVLVLLLASVPFASLSLLPPEITGGMTLLPQMMFAVVLILKVVAPHAVTLSPKFLNALQLRRLGYLALFLLVGIVSTLIMPRLFLGQVVVFPMRESWMADLLNPSQANFTQSGYVTLSVMTALAVTLMADEPGFTGTLLKALLAGGMVCVVTGLIDIAAASTGMESLLAPFRNANYAYLTNASLRTGVRRVVGLTPEAADVWLYLRRICRRDWASVDPLCGKSAARVRDDSCGQSGGHGAALDVLHCLWRLGGIGIGLRGELDQARDLFLGVRPERTFGRAARRPRFDNRAAVCLDCSRGPAEPAARRDRRANIQQAAK